MPRSPSNAHTPAGPIRLYLIDRQGTVRFKSKPGPFGFHVTDLAQAVKRKSPAGSRWPIAASSYNQGMPQWLLLLLPILAYIVLMRWVLPRFGVPT